MSDTDMLTTMRVWRDSGVKMSDVLQMMQKVWMYETRTTGVSDAAEDRLREKHTIRSWRQRYENATRTDGG